MSTPPPPQGQNPFAQGQPQAPYPPQQGAMPYAPVPEQPRRKITFKLVKNVVIVLAVAGAAIGGYIASRDDANTAAVGDCMHRGSGNDSNPDLEVVECSSSNAQYIVLAKVEARSPRSPRTASARRRPRTSSTRTPRPVTAVTSCSA